VIQGAQWEELIGSDKIEKIEVHSGKPTDSPLPSLPHSKSSTYAVWIASGSGILKRVQSSGLKELAGGLKTPPTTNPL
jgi:hypothetical protein